MNDPTTTLSQIQSGREGWVYLIHAEGTNRYKVGRSINPIARREQLQRQSPYPLNIVDSFWTVDATVDEEYIHRSFASDRQHGEWFEFEKSYLVDVKVRFEFPEAMMNLSEDVNSFISQRFGFIDRVDCHALTLIRLLYCSYLRDRKELVAAETFLREVLPGLASNEFNLSSEVIDGCPSDSLNSFLNGAIRVFVFTTFGRRLRFDE